LITGSNVKITPEEVRTALKDLSFNKAIGVDQLKDMMLRTAIEKSEIITEKIAATFEKWINGEEPIP